MSDTALYRFEGLNPVQGPSIFPTFTKNLTAFLKGPLQTLNDDIDAGKASLRDFLRQWEPVGTQMRDVTPLFAHMGERQGRDVLRHLAFVASSIEYHAQRGGEQPGSGIRQVEGMEDAMVALGRAAHHVPRDSHDTVWRWNTGPARIRFTGDEQENTFARAVIETDRVHTESCNAIHPVCWGTELFVSRQTAEALLRAQNNTRRLCEMYAAFRTPRTDWSLKPEFFMKRLRTFLMPYPVGGRMYTGPNAANIASQVSVDFLTGFGDRNYYERWGKERMQHMTQEDAFQVEMDATQAEPLSVLALRALNLPVELFVTLEDHQIAAHIVGQDADTRRSVTAFAAFAREQIRLSGTHWSLIKSHLINPGAGLTAEEKAKLPVKHDHGTGKTGHDDTYGIFMMRHNHPVISKLVRALALLPEGDFDEAGL